MDYIKSPEEIVKMRAASKVAAEILKELIAMVEPGVNLQAINQRAVELIEANGVKSNFSNYNGYPKQYVICASVNEIMIHGFPANYVIKDGDIVSIDFGVILDGYHADTATTRVAGKFKNEEDRLLVSLTKHALNSAIAMLKPGVTIGDIGSLIESIVREKGYFVSQEYTGHGIGKFMHENPHIPNFGTAGKGMKLKAGMTICIEPMVLIGSHETYLSFSDDWQVYALSGQNTAHEEHTILITEDGCEVLTQM